MPAALGRPRCSRCPSGTSVFVCLCACINLGCCLTLPVGLNALFNDWMTSFHTDRARTTTVQATCMGVMLGGGLLAALLERKLGARKSMMLGNVLAAVGLFGGGFAYNLPALILTVGFIAGSGFCLIHLCTLSTTVSRFSHHSGFVSGTLATFTGLFHLGTPLLYRYLSDLYSWRGGLFVVAGLSFQTAILGLILTSPLFSVSERSRRQTNRTIPNDLHSPFITADTDKPEDGTQTCSHSSDCNSCEDCRHQVGSIVIYSPTTVTVNRRNSESSSKQEGTDGTVREPESVPLKLPGECEECKSSKPNTAGSSSRCHLEDKPNGSSTFNTSRWCFLKNPLYLCLVATFVITLSTLFSIVVLILDFAQSKGWSVADGMFFNFSFMIGGLVGRTAVGLLSLNKKLSSVILLAVGSITGGLGIGPLGYVSDYHLIACHLGVMGFSFGALCGIYPSAVLQVTGSRSYPLAQGVVSTLEGAMQASVSILTGTVVDHFGSYTVPCLVYGLVTLTLNLLLILLYKLRKPPVAHTG